MRCFTFWEMLRFAVPIGTAKRNTSAKRKTMLRFARPHLRFGSYAVEIIITFCVKFLRFGSSSYVLGNVTFCGSTIAPKSVSLRPKAVMMETSVVKTWCLRDRESSFSLTLVLYSVARQSSCLQVGPAFRTLANHVNEKAQTS